MVMGFQSVPSTRRRNGAARAVLLLAVCGFVACAPKQRVPLDLGPGAVELYVDGRRVEVVPPEVELRADRPHKLFVKRPGYRPELIVLEAREVAGEPALAPDEVWVRLRPLTGDRGVEIEEAGADDRQP